MTTNTRPTVTVNETIERDEDWTLCLCGNQPAYDGFYASDAIGTILDYGSGFQPHESWDGDTMTCLSCGRIFSFATGAVSGRTTPEMLAGAALAL